MTQTTTATACPSTPTSFRCGGVTLPELLFVAALLAVVAATAVPNLASTENQRLRLAVEELQGAIRFARDESIRTGVIHSVEFYPADHQILVTQINDFGVLAIDRPVVYHPVTKQLYQLDLDDDATTAGTGVQGTNLNFDTLGSQNRIDFTRTGQPVHVDLANQPYRLLNGAITVELRGQQRTLTLDALTGRLSES